MLDNIKSKIIKRLGGMTMNEIKKKDKIFNLRNEDKLFDSLLETKVWLDNDIEELEDFYTGKNSYFFWNNSAINKKEFGFKKFHFPLLSLLNSKMNNVIFKSGITIPDDERLLEICEKNSFEDIRVKELATAINCYGGGFVKLGMNNGEVTIDIYDPLSVDVVKPGRVIEEIHFINVYEKYTLKEIYGKGFIKYEAYKNQGGSTVDVSVIDPDLKDIEFSNKEFMAAMYYANHGKNQYDTKQYLGKSVFDGMYSLADELDKQFSIMSKESTASMTTENYNEMSLMTTTDSDGRNVKVRPSQFMRSYTTFFGSAENATPLVTKGSYDGAVYMDNIKELMNVALMTYGISPQTMGVNNSGANASGTAKQLDEQTTIDTRDTMTRKLTIVLTDILEHLITFNNDVMQLDEINIDDNKIEFGQYQQDNINEWLDYLAQAEVLNAVDQNTIIEMVGNLFELDPAKIEEIKQQYASAQEDQQDQGNTFEGTQRTGATVNAGE